MKDTTNTATPPTPPTPEESLRALIDSTKELLDQARRVKRLIHTDGEVNVGIALGHIGEAVKELEIGLAHETAPWC